MSDYKPDRDRLASEIDAMLAEGDRASYPQPNITAAEWAAERGIGPDTARKRLRRLMARGKLDGVKIMLDGHLSWIFWKIDADT